MDDYQEDLDLHVDSEAAEFYNKYEPKEILGRGLSSVVRRCVHRETGREFAVKIIDMHMDEAVRQSIVAEIDVLTHLPPNKHIIYLQDHFESSTFHFLVFELARQGELFDYLTKMVKLSEKKTRHIMLQLLLAVNHMHQNNVVHRDLKPENILMDENLELKISDFGFSAKVTEEDKLTELLGTPGYLAPEMLKVSVEADAEGYNKEIDMWACGVIMYTLLAGFPPFWHRKQLIMLRAIMEGRYEFVSPEWDDISDEAKDMIRKMLTVDPHCRLTAREALGHPWLCFVQIKEEKIPPRRRLKAFLTALWFLYHLKKLHRESQFLNLATLGTHPYQHKYVRALIDSCAFKMYGHWVKRGEQQNRAALFETNPRTLSTMSTSSSVLHLFHEEPVSWETFA